MKLEKRECTGFLAVMKKHSTSEKTEDGMKQSNRVEFLSDHKDLPSAMKLFEEWVDTGKLRPTVKHKTYHLSPHILLYIFAYYIASEILCNQIVDDFIAHCAEIKMYPTVQFARRYYELAKGDIPYTLKELFVQYLLGQPASLVRDLDGG